jgi:hypothetical protein
MVLEMAMVEMADLVVVPVALADLAVQQLAVKEMLVEAPMVQVLGHSALEAVEAQVAPAGMVIQVQMVEMAAAV